MDLGATADKGLRGITAIVASLALHVVILGLFIWSGTDSPDPEPPSAEASSTESPSPGPESPSAEQTSPGNLATPPSASRPPRSETDSPKPAPKPAAKPRPAPAPAPAPETMTYVVKRGDNLAHIAEVHACSIQDLARLNGVPLKKFANLKAGQKIKVPKGTSPAP